MSPAPNAARWRRVAAAMAVAVVAAVATLFLTAAPATAHGQFVRSDPAAGTEVSTPLEAILLYFTEKPTSNAFFSVTAPSGARVDRLWSHGPTAPIEPEVHEWYHESNGDWVPRSYSTAYSASIPIAYWPEVGEYKVSFVSVATDGQPVRGEFVFTYAGAISELPPDYTPQGNEPDPNLLAVAPPGAPTAPPTGPAIDELVAGEPGPNLLIVWIPIGIVAATVVAALVYWRMRPEQARALVVSRFGGRYAAPGQRRPLALPTALSDRLPARRQAVASGGAVAVAPAPRSARPTGESAMEPPSRPSSDRPGEATRERAGESSDAEPEG